MSSLGQNLRVNPNTGALTSADTPLAYVVGDPNFGNGPTITAVAYSNNTEGAASTTLYGIDAGLNFLVRVGGPESNPSPNGGQLFTVGALGVDTDGGAAGFDIAPGTGRAFASLTVGVVATSRLYTINLATGQATLVGTIGGGTNVRDIAVLAFQRTLVVGAGAGGGPARAGFRRRDGHPEVQRLPVPGGIHGWRAGGELRRQW